MRNKTKKILIVSINYHTDEKAMKFIESLSMCMNNRIYSIHCMLIDNTERESSEHFFLKLKEVNSLIICVKAKYNLGYFGGAKYGLECYLKKNKKYPDWLIVSNVDLEFIDLDFFSKLLEIEDVPNLGVVAPRIWSKRCHRDLNPKILYRPSKGYMKCLRMVFSKYYFFTLFTLLSFLKNLLVSFSNFLKPGKENNNKRENDNAFHDTYAPHGSFIIFHKRFFQKGGSIDYPSFLFGEEIFVAETAADIGLRVVYFPKLKIKDYEHASTGLIKSRKIASYFSDSMNFLVERYFK